MSVIDRLKNESSGATMVVFVLLLVVLLGFTAIALDGAAAWSQRRQNQSAADTGALAGGIFIGEQATPAAIASATNEVMRITYETIDPDMAYADWVNGWTSCSDPDRPAEFTLVGISPCVSFAGDLRKIRVEMPTIEVPTTFGKILGRDFIGTGATAEAGTKATFSGGVLPFGLPYAVSDSTDVCLKSGANPQTVPPCDGPTTANFGFVDITKFSPAAKCSGNTADQMARNIMRGADHFLDDASHAAVVPLIDREVCTDGDFAIEPYTVTTETGNMSGVLHEGLVDGDPGDGIPGRLTEGSNTIDIEGFQIDDTPLWEFLNADGLALCSDPGSKAEMTACLDANYDMDGDWTGGIIFDLDIGAAPRWAWVPLFWEDDLGAGNTDRTIREFRPVYLQTTLWKCKANSCKWIHDPSEAMGGTGTGGGGSVQIEALTAVQVPVEALPITLQEAQPGTDGAKEFVLLK